jgi:hypothetical protein
MVLDWAWICRRGEGLSWAKGQLYFSQVHDKIPRSRDSSVSIVTRLRDGRPWFDSRQVQGFFLFGIASRPSLAPTGVKGPGRDADHSLPSRAEIKNAWSYTFTPQYVFILRCLIKQKKRLDDVVFSWEQVLLYFTFALIFVISHSESERGIICSCQ